jgi:hypothetical protein
MVGLCSALEIEVSLPFLAGPENAPVPGASVPDNNLMGLGLVISRCGRLPSVSLHLFIGYITP